MTRSAGADQGKLPTSLWVEIVSTAHEVGLRSSSTMMYGHVDRPRHWVAHLNVLRGIQDRTGGVHQVRPAAVRAPLFAAVSRRCGPAGPPIGTTAPMHALARIMLHGRISQIQTSWVKLGVERSQVMRRRCQRPRRHPDEGNDLPDGGLGARLGQDRRRTGGDRRGDRSAGAPANHHLCHPGGVISGRIPIPVLGCTSNSLIRLDIF